MKRVIKNNGKREKRETKDLFSWEIRVEFESFVATRGYSNAKAKIEDMILLSVVPETMTGNQMRNLLKDTVNTAATDRAQAKVLNRRIDEIILIDGRGIESGFISETGLVKNKGTRINVEVTWVIAAKI